MCPGNGELPRLKQQNGLVRFITNYIDSELSVIDVGSGSSALLYEIHDLCLEEKKK